MEWFNRLTDNGPTPALAAVLSFTQERHRVIAENIANLGTPGYKAKQVDVGAFQRSLGEAMDRRAAGAADRLSFSTPGFELGRDGRLRVTPSLRPADGLLFHDGTNHSLEREMADLAENGLAHQTAAQLLGVKFEGMRKAIRGRL